jgi:hypothetical protein
MTVKINGKKKLNFRYRTIIYGKKKLNLRYRTIIYFQCQVNNLKLLELCHLKLKFSTYYYQLKNY